MNTIGKVLEIQREWQSLSADDESVLKTVAGKSLLGCRDAISVLSQNLRNIGYVWATYESISAKTIETNVKTIETKTGLLIPKILVVFWKMVGGVSFVDLKNYRHIDFWRKQKIIPQNGFADGLYVDACNDEWASFICRDYLEWKKYFTPDTSEGFIMSLSPDGYHKDNISGGAPYGVLLESTWKPIWRNFEWPSAIHPITALANPPDFLSYLRTTILECAGFPALSGIPAFESIKEKLLHDVPVF